MIVTDLKGEIFRSTAGYRKSKGSQVFLFAPGSERSHRYNPLDFIRPDRGDRTTDIQNIAAILVPEVTESENSIWQATAQQVIAGAISYINESIHYREHRTLGEVTSFFNSGANLQAMMTLIKEREPYLSRFTMESFNAYIALSERAAASALLDIQKALRPFRNERVVAATSVTDMDLRALKRRPITIYLAPNVTDITLLRPLLALFVQQTLDVLMLEHSERSVPVYFLLDEFRQLKKMSEITTKLPYVAGYNVKIAFVIQDLKTLDEIYGETSRHSLMGNCGYQLVFGANDQVTAEAVSKSLGKRTVRYKTESRTIELMGLHRRTKVEQLRERDLMMPQEVRQMPGDKMVILAEGQGPIFADKLRFFRTAPFREMEKFSQAHLPDVPATEFLPPRPVPATTSAYVGEHNDASKPEELKGSPETVARPSARRRSSASNVPASKLEGQASAPAVRTAPARGRANGATPSLLDADFTKAARRLKTLAKAASEPRNPRDKSGNWGRIFDATIPDELEIVEAEAV
jgi:type IV secretion system protein VirD4